jgi:hypothetical protein
MFQVQKCNAKAAIFSGGSGRRRRHLHKYTVIYIYVHCSSIPTAERRKPIRSSYTIHFSIIVDCCCCCCSRRQCSQLFSCGSRSAEQLSNYLIGARRPKRRRGGCRIKLRPSRVNPDSSLARDFQLDSPSSSATPFRSYRPKEEGPEMRDGRSHDDNWRRDAPPRVLSITWEGRSVCEVYTMRNEDVNENAAVKLGGASEVFPFRMARILTSSFANRMPIKRYGRLWRRQAAARRVWRAYIRIHMRVSTYFWRVVDERTIRQNVYRVNIFFRSHCRFSVDRCLATALISIIYFFRSHLSCIGSGSGSSSSDADSRGKQWSVS